ncbi:hypothetical protein EVAR_8361_1 [Eumeta japonica]|uniref:Uncharacterized protein n=1 Tax=Eumeta variegata TaxID=151549 RepID=A0A4C1VBK3_EUMVA|nr:hypothetical protein EVAR_8361_1 [Eumeta japonica]
MVCAYPSGKKAGAKYEVDETVHDESEESKARTTEKYYLRTANYNWKNAKSSRETGRRARRFSHTQQVQIGYRGGGGALIYPSRRCYPCARAADAAQAETRAPNCEHYQGANELASYQRVDNHRRPWILATPEKSPVRCRPLA